MKPYAGLTVFGVTVALSSAMYLGQSPRPYDLVGIKFCPTTANINKADAVESQDNLDRKYCQFEHKLLKEVWEQKQFSASHPLPESSFMIRNIPAIDSGVGWFLVAPVASGIAYLCWSKKSEDDEMTAHNELEAYKTAIKLATVSNQGEREFKTLQTNRAWDKQKVKHGFISVEAMQDKLNRQTEIQDKTHQSTLKQFDTANSGMDKTIAENLRDAAKADKEREKFLGKVSKTEQEGITPDSKLKISLIEAVKSHEDGWLWKVIDNMTPLWLIGRQGSGKTYTAATIALIRKYCLDAPINYLIDRHATGDNQKAWKYLSVQNKAESEDEIADSFDALCSRWLLRIKGKNELEQPTQVQPEQVLVDEYTNLKTLIGEPAEKFYKLHLTDTRKAKVHVIGITHNDTNASYPENTQAMREAGTILIQKFSANGRSPLNRVKVVRGLLSDAGDELADAERTLPDWFNPKSIYSHFNGSPLSFEVN